ncbi:MAG: hypothetical protein WD114_03990 [Phycisphaerales bacterium]
MHHTHTAVHRTRAIGLGVLRTVSAIMVIIGLLMALNRMLFGLLGTGDLSDAWTVWREIGSLQGVFLGLPLIGVGVLVGLYSDRLTHWIVRPPAKGCSRCGYATLGEDGRCSECGYG